MDENSEKSYKKYDFDKNKTYDPCLIEFDGINAKSYKGFELEKIKNEYLNSIRYNLSLSMYHYENDEMDDPIYVSSYEFKDLVTIDEKNFYLDKSKNEKSGFTKRKAFYLILSNDKGKEKSNITMSDLENSEWLIEKSAIIEYYTQNDVEPYFDSSKGKGKIIASFTLKSGEDLGKLDEVKNKMMEMAKSIYEKKHLEKIEKIMKSPAKIKRHNETRAGWIQEKTKLIEQYQNEIKRLQKQIDKINSEMIEVRND